MSLQQIIIVDEENTVLTINSSSVNDSALKIEDSKRRIEVNTNRPLESFLRCFVKDEWAKIKELGARLVTRKARVNHGERFKK